MASQAKRKPVSKKTHDLMAAMAQDDTQQADEATLENIRKKIEELRSLTFENVSLKERISQNNERIAALTNKELVDMFDAAKVKNLGVLADGNLPPYEVEIKPYYHANIPEEKAEEAFAWLRKNKHGDMIKGTYTVSMGRGTEGQQKKLLAYMKKEKIPYSYKFGVPWNTLTAFVREQVEKYEVTPPLDLLGATVGRVAQVKKEKK